MSDTDNLRYLNQALVNARSVLASATVRDKDARNEAACAHEALESAKFHVKVLLGAIDTITR